MICASKIFLKKFKKAPKSGVGKLPSYTNLDGVSIKYQQKLILEQLKEFTTLVDKIEKRIKKNKK